MYTLGFAMGTGLFGNHCDKTDVWRWVFCYSSKGGRKTVRFWNETKTEYYDLVVESDAFYRGGPELVRSLHLRHHDNYSHMVSKMGYCETLLDGIMQRLSHEVLPTDEEDPDKGDFISVVVDTHKAR